MGDSRSGIGSIRHKLVRTLILLLAACEQTTRELKRTDVELDGLGQDLDEPSARLHDLLGEDRWRAPTA